MLPSAPTSAPPARLYVRMVGQTASTGTMAVPMSSCHNPPSVLDACNASGFTNYTSFLKTFRSLYGITPSEYRSQLRRTPERVHSTP